MGRPRAALLTIGDELLLGDVIDTNKAYIARALVERGLEVIEARTVPDDPESIAAGVRALQRQADCILLSGGLGPTLDDRSAEALALALERPIERHPEAEAHLRRHFVARTMPQCNLKQADLPAKCAILPNPRGSAVGIALRWERPTQKEGLIFALPGVPSEMRGMLLEEALPRCLEHFEIQGPQSLRRVYRLMGVGESSFAQRLGARLQPASWSAAVAQAQAQGLVGEGELAAPVQHYRAHAPELLFGLEFPQLRAWPKGLKAWMDQLLEEPMGEACYAVDAPELVEQCASALAAKGYRIAVAESCTGGGLGELLTRQPGSSDYFAGGVISYSNELKSRLLQVSPSTLQEFGAVSKECAKAMVLGLANSCGAEISVSITGVAGPGGGSDEKPVGTVFVGLKSPEDLRIAHLTLRGDRSGVRHRAAQWALRMVVDALAGRKTYLGGQGKALFLERLSGSPR